MSRGPVVVTGATGFLGKHLCAELLSRGRDVVALGRNFAHFPRHDEERCRTWVAPLDDRPALREACRGASAVIHCAALSSPWGERSEFVKANVDGTRNILEAAKAEGVPRFVHCSSSSVVFANADRRDINESEPLPARFMSIYSETKALAEDVVRGSRGIETVILRPRGIFGPGDTALLPRLIGLARTGRLRIVGSGKVVQDLTYVSNVADAHILAIEAPAAVGRTYFISNDEPVDLWAYLKRCLVGLGLPIPKRHVPVGVAVAFASVLESLHRAFPSLGEPKVTRYSAALLGRDQTLDIRAAKQELGYRPRVSMDEALVRTVEAFRG